MNAARKALGEKRDKQRVFRVNEDEYEEISTLAKFYGYGNPTEFIRRAALGYQQVDRKEAGLK